MRVFAPVPAEKSALLHPVHGTDYDRINALTESDTPVAEWPTIPFQIVSYCETMGSLELTDAPWLGSNAIVLSENAAHRMKGLLGSQVEFWPIHVGPETFYLLHPGSKIDALDENRSSVERFDDGSAMFIYSYVFHGQKCLNQHAFKISSFRVSPTFVSEDFVQTWRSNGLTGLEFDMLWAGSA